MAGAGEWAETGGALERELRFTSFSHAIEFVNRLAELAERENHHPEIGVSGSRVTVRWWTLSTGGVSDSDHRLARLTDALL